MRIKYFGFALLIMAFMLFMSSCDDTLELTLDDAELIMVEGDTHTIGYDFNGSEQLIFESSDESVSAEPRNVLKRTSTPASSIISS